ncbi:hypothetical protein BCR34DRAFT_587700 [Clohesyomyces aquaticus]|uniref:Uncharacterized protein n=1 Tax=Clohesyomyces aquaticus TaxID=1231657 RepID=A0A1Y1ZNB4_9PLEO|nr:hypothetical protein BCR34DRAFT_587700 [Clohesyomyces aquaticus]
MKSLPDERNFFKHFHWIFTGAALIPITIKGSKEYGFATSYKNPLEASLLVRYNRSAPISPLRSKLSWKTSTFTTPSCRTGGNCAKISSRKLTSRQQHFSHFLSHCVTAIAYIECRPNVGMSQYAVLLGYPDHLSSFGVDPRTQAFLRLDPLTGLRSIPKVGALVAFIFMIRSFLSAYLISEPWASAQNQATSVTGRHFLVHF